MIRSDEIIQNVADLAMCVVGPEASLRGVVNEMALSGQALAIVMTGTTIDGVVSEGDIIRAIYDGADLDQIWAADVMTASPIVVEPESAAWDVLELMLGAQIRHVIVNRDSGPGLVGFPDVVDLVLPR